MRAQTRTIAALVLLATAGWAVPSLTIAYHRDDHAAPLFDACLYPNDFRARYGLYLKQMNERESYSLIDGKQNMLSLRLAYCDTDSTVLAALLSGSAQVGILSSEEVLAAVLSEQPVRIVAPLQRAGDLLVVNPSVTAADWKEFVAWVRARPRTTTIGYIGQYSIAALGFMQALEYENLRYVTAIPGLPSNPESTRVRLIQADGRAALAAELSSGRFDAALLEEPAATWVSVLRGCRKIGRTDILPPGRFENRPGTIIATTDSAIRSRSGDIGRFLELMAVTTHYANSRTRNTLAAVCKWLGTSPGLESIPLRNMGFSSRPDVAFTTGIWNWYFALRLRNAVPQGLAGYMEEKDWLGVPYDSLLLMPALERAGARIIR
jgi:NitT/TauT family transport system substrate-binding protein